MLVIFLLFFIPSLALAQCPDYQYKVSKVIDGDTIKIESGHTIRILGIDTYDKPFSCDYNNSCSRKSMAKKQSIRTGFSMKEIAALSINATDTAKNLLYGRCVRLIQDYKDQDYYGRYLRYVEVDSLDYQEIMLERGLANVYCSDKRVMRFNKYLGISNYKCSK